MKLFIFLCVIFLVSNVVSSDFPWKWESEIPTLTQRNESTSVIFDKRDAIPNQEERQQVITDGVIVDPDKTIIDGSAGLLKIVKRDIKNYPIKKSKSSKIKL